MTLLTIILYRIRIDIFLKAAEEIVQAYPDERTSVYFVPAKPKTRSNSRTYNEGKLWNRYHTVQRALGDYIEFNDELDCDEDVRGMILNNNVLS